MKVKKAVIPCAGFGTRFLPVTKVMPKELLPIVDTPTLAYLIDEACKSGIDEVLIILSPQKLYMKKYFKPNRALNSLLRKNNKRHEYALANPDIKVNVSFAVQKKMNGNGMAVYLAKDFANGEPFAVLFGDDLMYEGDNAPVTAQLIEAYEKSGGKTVIGCQKTSEEVARRCGVMIAGEKLCDKVTVVNGIIEKPKGELPSELVSLGRFVLNPEIFDELDKVEPNSEGEVYLTDALDALAKQGDKVVACEFDGRRYDIGNKEGYLEATVEYALRDENLKDEFAKYLKTVK